LNADDVANARDQFSRAKRLGHIRVSARVKSLKAVVLVSSGGKKNDGGDGRGRSR
jgi:hypothetical protein